MHSLKSLLISNVLDPLTHDDSSLLEMYKKLSNIQYYDAIETRLIENKEVRSTFNNIAKENNWNVTFWITGNMSRKKLNLSSLDEELRLESVEEACQMIDQANEHYGHNIGIASGSVEDYDKIDQHIVSCAKSIFELNQYLKETSSKYKLLLEPLDYEAHKRNVLGDLSNTLKLIEVLKRDYGTELSICWDSAHVALNKESFDSSLQKLAPYITRIHFSDAIIDSKSSEYGDNHRHFDDKGIMNIREAKSIVENITKYSDKEVMFLACEARTKKDENSWEMEKKYRDFLDAVLDGEGN